jgi:hypothetical protein
MAWFTSGDQGEAVFEAVAGSVDVDHVAVVEEAVEDGDGQDVVAKNLAPFGGAFVAVMIMVPRSYLRETSWKTMLASARSKGR